MHRLLKSSVVVITAAALSLGFTVPASAWQDSQTKATPYGVLTADVWYDGGTDKGGTRKWNYAVKAKIGGKQSVAQIKTTWTGGASMRNSASFSLGASGNGVTVGGGSTWSTVQETKYWSNTNGARTASYGSNMVVAPRADYRFGTIFLKNTAYVKFKGDNRNWQITAAA